jgi:hypothetical protein
VRLEREHPDRAVGIVIADSTGRRVTRHPAADDQVSIRRHLLSILATSVWWSR